MARTILVQASPRDPATGQTVAIRLAGGGRRAYTQLGFVDWRAGVAAEPRFTTSAGIDQTGVTGSAKPQSSGIRFCPSDKKILSALANLFWEGASVQVSAGDDANPAETYPTVMKGKIGVPAIEDGAISLPFTDMSSLLDKPAVPDVFAGTGDLEGGDAATGRIKRRSFGTVFNVEGRVLDSATNVYEFGDPARQLLDITEVRDKGVAGSDPVVVAWKGTALDTLNALRAASAPQGGAAIAPSIACVKWWTVPAGPLTADLKGEDKIASPSVAAIAAYLIGLYAADIAITNQAQASGWKPGVAGVHCDDASETVATLMDRLCLPVSLLWVVAGDGTLTFRQLSWSNPTMTLAGREIARETVFKPLRYRRVGFQRNYRVQSDSEIAATLLTATDPTYEDGTPIDVLRPAQAGADVTGSNTASAIYGQGSLATLSGLSLGSPYLSGFGSIAGLSSLANGSQYLTGFGLLSSLANLAFNSGYLLTSGGQSATDSAYQTGLGTAAAILGQGLFATAPQLGVATIYTYFGSKAFSLNNTLRLSDGATTLTEAAAVTALGSAAAIAGQGALATLSGLALGSPYLSGFGSIAGLSSLANGSSFLTGFGPLSSFANLAFNSGYLLTSGGANATDSAYQTGLGTSAAIAGQGPGATAAASNVLNSYIPVGANAVVLSDFQQGLAATFFPPPGTRTESINDGTGATATVDRGLNLAGDPNWFGLRQVPFAHVGGTLPTGAYIDAFYTPGPWGVIGQGQASLIAHRNYMLPVQRGGTYFARILAARHRCGFYLYGLIFDQNGGFIGAASWQGGRVGGAQSGDPAYFDELGGVFLVDDVVPANAAPAYMMLMVRMIGTGEADPYLFCTEPMMGRANPGQTVLPPYMPGPGLPQADQTGTNTAAAIAGQGTLATLSGLALGSPYLSGFGSIAGLSSLANGSSFLTGFGALSSFANLAFNSGYLLTSGGASATDSAYQTGLGTAAAILGQGAFATAPQLGVATIYTYFGPKAFSLNNTLRLSDGATTLTEAAAVTALGSAAAIAGQGTLATANTISSDSQLSGYVGQRLAPFDGDPTYLYAGRVAWAGGDTVQNYKPQEAGSNVTETRSAAAITGQGALATENQADWGSAVANRPQFLTDTVQRPGYSMAVLRSDYVVQNGDQAGNGVPLASRWPQEAGANVTEARSAAAISGQSAWATYGGLDPNSVSGQVQKLQTDGNIQASAIYQPGVAVLSNVFPAQAGADKTSTQTAASIAGQGAFATAGQLSAGNLFSYFALNSFSLGYTITRQDGTSIVTESLAITSLGVAAAVSGQGALATQSSVNGGQVVNGSIVSGNGVTRIDLDAGRIIFNTGSVMKVSGNGFGSSGQFVEWFGPSLSDLSQCSESNAVQYLKVDGSAYFGGSLSAGQFHNAVQTSSTDPGANVTTGTVGSNGGTRTITLSYNFTSTRSITNACPAAPTVNAVAKLYRGADATGVLIGTLNVTNGSWSCDDGHGAAEPGSWFEAMSGSITVSDTSGGTSVSYYAVLTSRNALLGTTVNQRLAIVQTEN